MIRIVVSILLMVGFPLTSTSAQESGALAKFIGNWSCKGNFTSNGAPITADLSIQDDERSGALIVRHDDVPPGAYHALETSFVYRAAVNPSMDAASEEHMAAPGTPHSSLIKKGGWRAVATTLAPEQSKTVVVSRRIRYVGL
jgi:hypothetical protein